MSTSASPVDFDAVIVGAGAAGLYALHRLRRLGLSAKVFESGSGVGGTWFWNRYPGARCDIESLEYSYQFDDKLAQEWHWSERFAAQPEILRYLQHVADRFDLHKDIRLNTTVASATYEDPDAWVIKTEDGATTRTRFCIMALGCLSSTNMPNIEGMSSFEGLSVHTGRWPADGVELSGKRVAVIGTGSSGVQVVSGLAKHVKQLFVFQRTPGYVVPAHNQPMDTERAAKVKERYKGFRAEAKTTANGHHPGPYGVGTTAAMQVSEREREEEFERRWQHGGLSFLTCFTDLTTDPAANASIAEFVRRKIRSIVKNTKTADLLCPSYPIGGKRLCVSTDYYETFNNPAVSLVDASSGIEWITSKGVRVKGQEYEVDCIVYATGYDAFTGPLFKIDIRGRDGLRLRDKWAGGARTYLGLASVGFPNLFMITGPGSPSVLTNVLPSIEQHVDWIVDCLAHLRAEGNCAIEAEQSAEDDWMEHHGIVAMKFLRSSVKSWWNGGNIPGKAQVPLPYMGGVPAYTRKCEEVAKNGYVGFIITSAAPQSSRASKRTCEDDSGDTKRQKS